MEEDCEGAMKQAFSYDEKVLVETGVNAREIELAVLCGDNMEISGAGEIVMIPDFIPTILSITMKKMLRSLFRPL